MPDCPRICLAGRLRLRACSHHREESGRLKPIGILVPDAGAALVTALVRRSRKEHALVSPNLRREGGQLTKYMPMGHVRVIATNLKDR